MWICTDNMYICILILDFFCVFNSLAQRCYHHQLHQLFDQFLFWLCGLLLPRIHVPQAQCRLGQSCQRWYGIVCLCWLNKVSVDVKLDIATVTLTSQEIDDEKHIIPTNINFKSTKSLLEIIFFSLQRKRTNWFSLSTCSCFFV